MATLHYDGTIAPTCGLSAAAVYHLLKKKTPKHGSKWVFISMEKLESRTGLSNGQVRYGLTKLYKYELIDKKLKHENSFCRELGYMVKGGLK